MFVPFLLWFSTSRQVFDISSDFLRIMAVGLTCRTFVFRHPLQHHCSLSST